MPRIFKSSILGSFDGMNTGLGLVAPAIFSSINTHAILVAAVSVIMAGAMSMSVGEKMSDSEARRSEILQMALFWALPAAIPVLAQLVLSGAALAIAVCLEILILGFIITFGRESKISLSGLYKTYKWSLIVAIPTSLVALL